MRFCRFDDNRIGVVEGDRLRDVTEVLEQLPPLRWPVPQGDHFMCHFDRLRPEMERLSENAAQRPLADVKLLSPIANPGKIIGAPVNYKLHLEESRQDKQINFGSYVRTIDEYGVFLKAPSALVGPSEGVVVDWEDRRIDHEVELAVVVGKPGFRISERDALDHVAGYTVGLDMTIRGTEDRSFRKSLDSFAVLGPWMVTADEIPDPNALDLCLTVNGAPRQAANTRLLIFNVQKLIAYASRAYTLYPGDVIFTGTPEGVGPVEPGDVVHAEIEGIGGMEVNILGPRRQETAVGQ